MLDYLNHVRSAEFPALRPEGRGVVQVEKISKAEAVKQQSRQLRGHLARDLADTATPFDGEGYSLLKFHGIYQGYDRDSATELKQAGNSKHYQLMVRVRIPGGRLTAAQYLALDKIAGDYANDTLRVTTRQSIQFHGVVKSGLKAAMGEINAGLMTTLAACGDVVRTVTTVAGADPRQGARPARGRRAAARLGACCRRPAPTRRSGSTARRGARNRELDESRPTRSTATAICRASSRSASRCPRTTRSTC